MSERKIKDIWPKPGDTCAITVINKHKEGTLLFDQVWSAPDFPWEKFSLDPPPKSVIFYSDSIARMMLEVSDVWLSEMVRTLISSKKEDYENRTSHDVQKLMTSQYMRAFCAVCAECEIDVTPIYPTLRIFNDEFQSGDHEAYQAVLENIDVVDAQKLGWDQVLEFRKDQQSRDNYRALRIWIQDALKGKSIAECTDIIGDMLIKYEEAIEKHGFTTKIGAFKTVFTSGAIGLSGIMMPADWAAMISGALAVGSAWAGIEFLKLDLEEIERSKPSEIALIHEIKKEFGKPDGE